MLTDKSVRINVARSQGNAREVPLLPSALTNLFAVMRDDGAIARNHHHAARRAIEPMRKLAVIPVQRRASTLQQ